jgi:hypothetical protein
MAILAMLPLTSEAVAVIVISVLAVKALPLIRFVIETTGNDGAAATATTTAFEVTDTPLASVTTAVKL